MKFRSAVTILLLLLSFKGFTQTEITPEVKKEKKKGSFYFAYGYNKDWFSKSDLHFKNTSNELNPVTGNHDYYNFTVYDAVAADRPGFKDIFRTDLSIPQYVYRIGYYFNNKSNTGLELSFDHVKYIVVDNQTVHVKGDILHQQIDADTTLENWLHFEHSDGANFLMLNFLKRFDFYKAPSGKLILGGVLKPGLGTVIPRTDVTLFGERLNNKFHVAGYVAGVEAGLHAGFFKRVFLEYTFKGTYANYTNVLVIGNGKAHHHFETVEMILTVGVQFPL